MNLKVKDAFQFELVTNEAEHPTWKKKSKHYVKFRPDLLDWLHDMSSMYELHIYTAGTRIYAETIAKLIDPSGELFQDVSGKLLRRNIEANFLFCSSASYLEPMYLILKVREKKA